MRMRLFAALVLVARCYAGMSAVSMSSFGYSHDVSSPTQQQEKRIARMRMVAESIWNLYDLIDTEFCVRTLERRSRSRDALALE